MKILKTKKAVFELLILLSFFLTGCKSVDLEKQAKPETNADSSITSIEQEAEQNEAEMHEYLVQEEVKVQDIEPIVVYVEKPVYVPEGFEPLNEKQRIKGYDASKASEKKATVKPEHYKNGTFYYTYNEDFVFEIYAQPYHLTDIILEDGEIVMGNPLLSEDETVWELTANVAKNPLTGESIQHLFIKPAYAGLDSSFVIITDRRVYHFRVKSYRDTHMSMVKFKYPQTRNIWATKNDSDAKGVSIENDYVTVTNPEFLSFDYKMQYGFKKPEFLPQQVYDDGNKTYIVVNDVVLHKELPLVFNEKNEIVNYSVQKNVFIIPRLINKVTLRLGKQKVTIIKKKTKETKPESSKSPEKIENSKQD